MIICQQTRGLLSSNDQLALDLPFAETKSIAARVGPTPVLTRGSTGTYFGPLINVNSEAAIPTTGVSAGRAYWSKTVGGTETVIRYNGSRWQVEITYFDEGVLYDAAEGAEWRPDQADWSGSGINVTTSSTFGIVRAANNEPRLVHNPVTLASRGLLIEEGRTNTCLQSENFGTTWSNDTGLVAISVDQTTSPSGAMNADKVSENTTVSNRRITIQNQSFVSGTTYTFSCFVKAAERGFVQMRFGSAVGGQFQNFIVGGVNAGTIGSGTGATSAIQAYPNGWYRCSITATSATTGSSQVTIGPQVSSTALAWQPYVGTLGSGIFVWGAQNEVGSFPTSYIPTTTSALARSADVCSITGANFTSFYNQLEGTLFASGIVDTVGVGLLFPFFLNLNDGTTNNRIVLGSTNSGGSAVRPIIVNSGSAIYNQSVGTVSAGQSRKVALAYKANNYMAAANSQLATAGTTGLPPSGLIRADINSSFFVGTISAIRYYKKRLPNAKLQALTA